MSEPEDCVSAAANTHYRDQIRENVLLKQYYCDVDVGHLISFNEELAHRLVTEPAEIIPLVSLATAHNCMR